MTDPKRTADPSGMNLENLKTARSANEWLRSTLAYLDWRAASSWAYGRHASQMRWNQERIDYLDAWRTVNDVFIGYAPVLPARPQLVIQPTTTETQRQLAALQLSMTRPAMAAELAALRPELNVKILSHLPKQKLALMLANAREVAAASTGVAA